MESRTLLSFVSGFSTPLSLAVIPHVSLIPSSLLLSDTHCRGVRACSTIRLPVDSQSISSFGWPRKDSVIICVQVFWGTYALISLGSMFRSRKLGQKNANILRQDFMVCVMTWTLQMSFFIA